MHTAAGNRHPLARSRSAFSSMRLTRDMPFASTARRLVRAAGAADLVARTLLQRTACAARRREGTFGAWTATGAGCAVCARA